MSVNFEVKSVYLLVSVFVFILVLQTKLYHAQCRSLSVHNMMNGLAGSSLRNYSHPRHHHACDSTIEK